MITLFRREIEALFGLPNMVKVVEEAYKAASAEGESSSCRACRLSCLIDIGAANGSIPFVTDVGSASCLIKLEVKQRECN